MATYVLSSDPRYTPRYEFVGDGDVWVTPDVPHERFWTALAEQQGIPTTIISGQGDSQEYVTNPAYEAFKQNMLAQGYEVGMQDVPGTNYEKNFTLLKDGQPVSEPQKIKTGSTFGEALGQLAPVILPAFTAGFGADISKALGVSKPIANALISGGFTAATGGDISDIASSALTSAAGGYAAEALGGGDSLLTSEMQGTISSNPQGAFLGESAIPSPVTSPTVTSGVLPAIDPFADAVVDQVGNVISGSTGEVLIPAQAAGTAGTGVNSLADAMTGVDTSGNVVNALTGEVIAPAGVANTLVGGAADAMTGVDMSGNVVNSMTGEVIAPAGVTAGAAAAAAGAGAGAATDAAAGGDPTRAALYGDAGYGEGMTGGETTAYDTGLAAGAAGAGAAGAGAAGTGAGAAGAGAAGAGAAGAGTTGTTLGVSDALWAPIIGTIASLYSGSEMAAAARDAAQTQADAYNRATDLQEKIYKEGVELQRPFYEGGKEAFNRLTALSTGGPEAAQNFLTMDPGYGFRLGEGMKALERLQASRGGLLSGGAIKAGQRYAQDVASQEYGNAYNRLAQLADVGPRAAGVTSQLGQNYATSAGGLMGQSGVNSANALLTGAAARQSAYGDIGNLWGRYFGGGK